MPNEKYTVESLRATLPRLQSHQRGRFGQFGERIYTRLMTRAGYTVDRRHSGNTDFVLDKTRPVDVKTTMRVDGECDAGTSFRTRYPHVEGVECHVIVFLPNEVVAFMQRRGEPNERLGSISWVEATDAVNETLRLGPVVDSSIPDERPVLRERCRELQAWIADCWGKKAKVIYRASPQAQRNFGAWGPNSFYHDQRSKGVLIEMVVLLYVDGVQVQRIFAYPTSKSSAIAWRKARAGSPAAKPTSFDPATLDPQFIFEDLEQFKTEFPRRFAAR